MPRPSVVHGRSTALKPAEPFNGPTIDLMPDQPTVLQTNQIVAQVSEALGATHLEPDMLEDVAAVYPPDDVNQEEPIAEEVLMLAGAIQVMLKRDIEQGKLAVSLGMKAAYLLKDLDKFDQKRAGISAMAMDSIAGQRHGLKRSRLMYRMKRQTFWERLKDWGHNPEIKNIHFRLLFRGGDKRYEDISYWIIQRGAWCNFRPRDGIMTVTVRPEIPTDAFPEETAGDDFSIYEGMPQRRIVQTGKQVVKTDADILFTSMGFRAPRSFNMAEWMVWSKEHSASKQQKEKDKAATATATGVANVDEPLWKEAVRGLRNWILVPVAVIGLFVMIVLVGNAFG